MMPDDCNRDRDLSRREFVGFAAAAAAAAGLARPTGVLALAGPAASQPPTAEASKSTATAASLISGKDARLTVHNPKAPEIETPLELLRAHRLTPKELLFVRNNHTLAGTLSLEPWSGSDWNVELTGMVEFPRTITLERLRSLPQVECEMVVQCSGNGRAFLSRAAKAQGAQWRHGAMGNVKFRGVTLRQLIEATAPNLDPGAKFVTAEGRDDAPNPESADFEHSLPLADALDRSIIALELNGEPLPALHGGPVRLVTPGYYGTMHVKWLSRLRFEAEETFNHHQIRRYRTPHKPIAPGGEFVYGRENSEPNWRMRIKAVIFAPLEGEAIAAGKVNINGVAFNDGASAIESVLISTDGGKNWQTAPVDAAGGPYAWHHWQTEIDLAAGKHEIIARAVDALGRSQPLDAAVQWNPAGYGYSAADRVAVEVS